MPVVNGTAYHELTDPRVIATLEQARQRVDSSRHRLRLEFGDRLTGRRSHVLVGYISRSVGTHRVPLCVHNRRSQGGQSFSPECIIRITYTHAPYSALYETLPKELCMSEEVAKRNDALRRGLPAVADSSVKFVMTSGVVALPPEVVEQLIARVRGFDDFSEKDDPCGEHDFGSIELAGQKFFWSIDDYAGTDGISLVLTIMLASEY